jgi:hypothetical protein
MICLCSSIDAINDDQHSVLVTSQTITSPSDNTQSVLGSSSRCNHSFFQCPTGRSELSLNVPSKSTVDVETAVRQTLHWTENVLNAFMNDLRWRHIGFSSSPLAPNTPDTSCPLFSMSNPNSLLDRLQEEYMSTVYESLNVIVQCAIREKTRDQDRRCQEPPTCKQLSSFYRNFSSYRDLCDGVCFLLSRCQTTNI